MSKSFSKLREELYEMQLNEEIYFGEMSDELLESIIQSEDCSEYDIVNALITLHERELFELEESEYSDLCELATALPAPSVPAKTTLPTMKSTSVSRPLPMQKSLPSSGGIKDVVGGKTLSSKPNMLPSATKSIGSAAKTTLGSVGKAALGAVGRLASKYSPHATALATGYQAGKQLNNISAVNKVTDKVGKFVAGGLQKLGIGSAPEVVKAKSPEVSRKAPDMGPKSTVQAKSGGGTVSFPAAAKPAMPKMPSKPVMPTKSAMPKMPSKPAMPQTNNTLGMSSKDYNSLRASAKNMGTATAAAANKTSAMKTSMQKFAGKPAASTPMKSLPKPSAPAKVSGGAPTTAIGSKPPTLSSSALKNNPSSGGGKWM